MPESRGEDVIRMIPLHVQLAFSRAAAQTLADRVGIRMLHIKGDAVDQTLQRDRRSGHDVDVLVDPRGIPVLHRTLLRHGWRVYSTFRFGSAFEHAQTYLHDTWGFLDLHRRFPGISLDDQAAFDLLWADRTERQAARIAYPAPGLEAQVVLLVLNAVRGRRALPAFWDKLDDSRRDRCRALVHRLDADVAFGAAMGDLEAYRDRREYLLWKATTQGAPRIVEWWGRVIAQPTLVASLRVVAQAPVVNTDRLTRSLGRAPSRTEIVKEFFTRGTRGVREVVAMLTRRGR